MHFNSQSNASRNHRDLNWRPVFVPFGLTRHQNSRQFPVEIKRLYKDGELEIVPIIVKELLDKSGHEVVRG